MEKVQAVERILSVSGEAPTDEEIMRAIIKRVRSPMWWARLSYPNDPRFWNDDERRVLGSIG